MKLIELTNVENQKLLVNFQNVTHVTTSETGSVIYTIKDSGYHVIHVVESFDEILKKLKKE